ncbi:LCCL domain-containing protein [Picosynechococcus sp. NKBG15041c]|uniref:LCCL domain-containing protein n=1 Tax=Picosynechococcus sp. NKBG15041c TaxID=1407650 RepID=UPI000415FCFC|nr:LCCL domain-containing protein [Picosynechococcus sp. NKBG15041c]
MKHPLPLISFGAIALITSLAACNNQSAVSPSSGGAVVSPGETPTPDTPAPAPELTFTALEWSATPISLEIQGQLGQTFEFSCPPGSANQPVWGTGIYTSDSSICTAAVHAGLFTAETGGDLSLEVLAGENFYTGSSQNEVTTDDYGPWEHSFRFPEAIVSDQNQPPTIRWDSTPGSFSIGENIGDRYRFTCPAVAELQTQALIWGTDTYTNDSAICVAAVHAGKITALAGGPVTIEITPGEDSYSGGDRNGVVSADYGPWGSSFIFVDE